MTECFHCGHRAVIWDSDFNSEDYGFEEGGLFTPATVPTAGLI